MLWILKLYNSKLANTGALTRMMKAFIVSIRTVSVCRYCGEWITISGKTILLAPTTLRTPNSTIYFSSAPLFRYRSALCASLHQLVSWSFDVAGKSSRSISSPNAHHSAVARCFFKDPVKAGLPSDTSVLLPVLRVVTPDHMWYRKAGSLKSHVVVVIVKLTTNEQN